MKQSNVTVAGWLAGFRPLIWLALAVFILYGRSLNFGYSYLDDTNLIQNRMEQLTGRGAIVQAFREDVFHTAGGGGFYYRPLLTVSFIADAVAGNGSLVAFRLSGILFHLLASFLLFACLSAMRYERLRSFLLALIFLVHPALTQAVAWIPGRNDSLLAVFILTSFLAFLRYLDGGKTKYLVYSTLAWLMALLTKESAIVLPLLLLAATSLLGISSEKPGFSKPVIFWVLAGACWFLARISVLGAGGFPVSQSVSSLIANLPALLPFLGKSLFPFFLSVFPVMKDMTASLFLGIAAFAVLAALFIFTKPRRTAVFGFAVSWFLLFLIPAFIKNTQAQELTEHRIYLPLIGIILFFAETGAVRNANLQRWPARAAFGGVIVLFAVLSTLHLEAFRDRYAFWKNAIATSPSNAYSYNTLGALYFLDGDLDAAGELFRKSLGVNPDEPQANGNLGLFLMRKGDLAGAEPLYKKEIRLNPSFDHAWFNYGLLLYKTGRVDSALVLWEKTIQVNPGYTDAYKALMQVYQDRNQPGDYERIGLLAQRNGLTGN